MQNIPVYIWDLGSGENFYGFPEQVGLADSGVKVAYHSLLDGRKLGRPEEVDRAISDADTAGLRAVLQRKMPALNGELLETAICMYTMSPDEHL